VQQIKEVRQASEQKLGAELETLRVTAQAAAEERERLACEGHDAVIVLMKEVHRKALGESNISVSLFASSPYSALVFTFKLHESSYRS
jgi:hypothetical protein